MKVSLLEWTIFLLSINNISTYPAKHVFENRKTSSEYPFSKFIPTFNLRGFEERNANIGYISRNERSSGNNEDEPKGFSNLSDHNRRKNYTTHRLGSKIDIDLDKKIVHMHLGEEKKAVHVSRFVEETGLVVDIPKKNSTNVLSLGKVERDESNKKRSIVYSLDRQTTDKDGLQNISKKIIKTLLVVRNNFKETDTDLSTSTVTALDKQLRNVLALTTPLLPLVDILKIATNMSTKSNATDDTSEKGPQTDNDTSTTIEPNDNSGKIENNKVKFINKPIMKRKFVLGTAKPDAQNVGGLRMTKEDYNSVRKKIEAMIRHHKHNGKLISKIRLGIGKNGEIVKAMRLDITNKCVRKVHRTSTTSVSTTDLTSQLAATTKEDTTVTTCSDNELKGNKVMCTGKPCDCVEITTTTVATSTEPNSNKSTAVLSSVHDVRQESTRGWYTAGEYPSRTCPYCRSILGTTQESFAGTKAVKSEHDPTTSRTTISSDEERLNSIFYEIWNPLPNLWDKRRLHHLPSGISNTPAPITCVPSPRPEQLLTTERKKKTVIYLEGDYGDEYEENVVFVPQTLNCKQLFDICKLCKDELSTSDSQHSTKTSGLVTAPRRKLIFRKDKANSYKTLIKHEKRNQNVHAKADRDDQNSITFNIEIKIPAEELRQLEKNDDSFIDKKVKFKRMNDKLEGKRRSCKFEASGTNVLNFNRRKDKSDEDDLVGIDMGTDDAFTAEDIEKELSRPFIKVRRLDKHSNRQTKHDQAVLRSGAESPLMRMLAANMRKYKKKMILDESTESMQEGDEVTEEEPADIDVETETGDLRLDRQLVNILNRNMAHELFKPSTPSPTTNIVVFYIIEDQLIGTEKYQEPSYSE